MPSRSLCTGPTGSGSFRRVWYRLSLLSFCLSPGAWRPGGPGPGYTWAPIKGPKAKIVQAIVGRSARQRDITQEQVQVLLWAILARTALRDMPLDMQALARRLLTPAQLSELGAGSLPALAEPLLERLVAALPPAAQELLRRENEVRARISAGATYADIQAAATAEPGGPTPGSRRKLAAKFGAWCHHPGGALLRYDVEGLNLVHVWIVVPRQVRVTRDALGRITSLDDGQGRRIETTYRPRGVRLRSDPNLRMYAFASVRFIARDQANRSKPREFTLRNRGWTFVGRPGAGRALDPADARRGPSADVEVAAGLQDAGGGIAEFADIDGVAEAIGDLFPGANFEEMKERYEKAKELKEQYDGWEDNVRKSTGDIDEKDVEDFFDTDHYKDGLDTVLEHDIEGQGDWLGKHALLGLEAAIYAAEVIGRVSDSVEEKPTPTPKPFNPVGITEDNKAELVVPQEPQSQLLKVWERLFGK